MHTTDKIVDAGRESSNKMTSSSQFWLNIRIPARGQCLSKRAAYLMRAYGRHSFTFWMSAFSTTACNNEKKTGVEPIG